MKKNLQKIITAANKDLQESGYHLGYTLDPDVLCMQRGAELTDGNNATLFPICLNNGYYNQERIMLMMKFLPHFCSKALIFFTDGPAQNTYVALGKNKVEAERKARLQHNRLYNHCQKGIEQNPAAASLPIQFDDWKTIYGSEDYQEEYHHVRKLYEEHETFRSDVHNDTQHVLSRLVDKEDQVTEEMISKAVDYPIEELAFILSVPKRFKLEQVVYVYYDRWSVLENLLDGKYDGTLRKNISYLMLTLEKIVGI